MRFSGSKFRQVRRDHHTPLEHLCVPLGRSYMSLRNYETERTTPPPEVVERAAEHFGVTVEVFLTDEPPVCRSCHRTIDEHDEAVAS